MALDGLKLNRKQLAIIAQGDPESIRQLEKLFLAAGLATQLVTARKLNGEDFDGSKDINIPCHVADEVALATPVFPLWVGAAGDEFPFVSTTKFSFIPSTGAASASSFNGITGLGTSAPADNTGAAVGTSTAAAHADHRHNSDWVTGDVKFTIATVAATGWVLMNDGTIGDSLSGGTSRANADCHALFLLLWSNTLDAWCPVSTGRGGSAEADWAAHKTIAIPKALGRALAAAGSGSGLTARALGETLGEETHKLVSSEMPTHTHVQDTHTHLQDAHTHLQNSHLHGVPYGSNPFTAGGAANNSVGGGSTTNSGSATATNQNTTATNQNTTATNQNAGGDGSHNNMQPTVFLNVMIHL